MRFLSFTILILILNISMGFVANLGFLTVEKDYANDWFSKIEQEKDLLAKTDESNIFGGQGGFLQNLLGDIAGYIQLIFGGLKFIGLTLLGVVWFPRNLDAFGVVNPLRFYLSVIYYIIFSIGVIQFISNRSGESMS